MENMTYRYSEEFLRAKMRKFILGASLASILILFFCSVGVLTERYDFLWIGLGLPFLIYCYFSELRSQIRQREFSLELSGDVMISKGRGFELKSPVDRIKKVVLQKSWSGKNKSVILKHGFLRYSKIDGLERLDDLASDIAKAISQERVTVSRVFHH